jgi:serine/threonine-protein kinase RsbW
LPGLPRAVDAGAGRSAAGARMTRRELELELPARAENVAIVRHALAGLAEAMDMETDRVADLKTVVTEACMNVVIHAYEGEPGPLEVDAHRDEDLLVVVVRDQGAGIRPRPESRRQSLKMGLPLIAALSSSFEIRGGPGRGTQVTMRVVMSSNGDVPSPPPIETESGALAWGDGASMTMPAGALVSPVLSRIISLFAVRANFSVDRLSDAVLLGDAISAHAPAHFPAGTARVAVDAEGGVVSVRVGPLLDGAGARLIKAMKIPGMDASLEGLADRVKVEEQEGAEVLLVEIASER